MSARDDFSIQSLLGHDSFVQGNLKTQGLTRIDGSINGNVEIDGEVIIGSECKIRGNIRAGSVTLLGSIVQGNIESSEKVRLTKGAVVLGDVTARNIRMDEGCIINGHCVGLSDEKEKNAASDLYAREGAIKAAVQASGMSAPTPPEDTAPTEKTESGFSGSPGTDTTRVNLFGNRFSDTSRTDNPDGGFFGTKELN